MRTRWNNTMQSKTPSHHSNSSMVYATITTHTPRAEMTHEEGQDWIGSLRLRLEHKMRRERVYLSRRAARGTHTPTDDAYEDDQHLEAELLALLDEIAQRLAQEG